jgi:hypothetical protein
VFRRLSLRLSFLVFPRSLALVRPPGDLGRSCETSGGANDAVPAGSAALVRQLPPLTLLVVSEVNGQPSPGVTATQQIPEERQRVFGFDWLDHPAPTPELLEQAVRQQPSNGVTVAAMEDALSQLLPP